MTNCGCDDLHARCHAIERSGKIVAAAGERGPDDDDAIPNGIGRHFAIQQGDSADRPDGAAPAVEREGKDVIDVRRDVLLSK